MLTRVEHRQALMDIQVRGFSHQTKYSDGDIYRNIRRFELKGSLRAAREWRVHLTSCKEKILNLLLKKKHIVRVLDELLPMPGLWPGLQLGNVHKDLALRCDEQIIHHLRHDLLTKLCGLAQFNFKVYLSWPKPLGLLTVQIEQQGRELVKQDVQNRNSLGLRKRRPGPAQFIFRVCYFKSTKESLLLLAW